MTGKLRFILLSALATSSLGGAAVAEEVMLRLGTHNPATHAAVIYAGEPFMKAVRDANVGIDFEFYPGEQAGKALQMYDLVRSGAVDIGYMSTAYVSADKMPLLGVWEMPGLAKSSCSVVNAMFELGTPGGMIYENTYKPNGVRVLAWLPYPPYGPAAATFEIDSIEDLQGKKLRTAGGLMELTAGVFGGVPVKLSGPEVYEGLHRGTADAFLGSYLGVANLKLNEVAKFGTVGFSWGTPGDQITISEARFQSLTKEQQDALLEAGRLAAETWCNYSDSNETKIMADLESTGMKIHRWSAEDIARMEEMTAHIGEDWVATLEARGLPAAETLAAFAEAVAK